ncbi:MAG: TfoX/Sxy family protein [Thermoanaerobaculia bacterium]|jgi:hypothetical protein|nr:TfoX/Sxy family protein [Thermoanaerobaculia bacterium]MBP9826103.1 TfoX/Sxy family protein [Thermoanaerobaculia bacterium]
MPYDEGLAERIREVLHDRREIVEKRMFGGIAFLLQGHMVVGIVSDNLMCRVGPDRYERALTRPFARPMDFTGKPLKGFVFVAPGGFAEDGDLELWIGDCLRFVESLPPKTSLRAAVGRPGRR